MGKCVSKHPSALTIALSEKDLATANQIWSKFVESTEYIALKDEHGNQLCEYYNVSKKTVDDRPKQQNGQREQQKQQQHQDQHQHEKQLHQQQHRHQQPQLKKEKQEPRSENKSGRWSTEKIDYDDDTAVKATYTKQVVTAAATTTIAADDVDADDSVLQKCGNITNNSHNDRQHCWAYLHNDQQKQSKKQYTHQAKHHASAAFDGTTISTATTVPVCNNNPSENIAGVKKCKDSKNKTKQQMKKKITKLSNWYDEDVEKSYWPNFACKYIDGESLYSQQAQEINFLLLRQAYEGQTESKKNSKKHTAGSIETKGTAMSFGFRKKLNTTPKKLKKLIEGETKHKKQDKCNNFSERDDVDAVGGYCRTETTSDADGSGGTEGARDDNGNAEATAQVHFEKVGAAAVTVKVNAEKPPANVAVSEHGWANSRPGSGNRFGYRGNSMARPASTGITPRYSNDARDNVENNNCSTGESGQQTGLVSNLKRRSKSAHAGRTLTSNQFEEDACSGTETPKITQPKSITFNLNRNSTLEYQRQQFFQQPPSNVSGRVVKVGPKQQQLQQQNIIHTGMHTNVIVRPTPRSSPAVYSKFTLHTVSLPKPEFPVAISLNATTPTTPGSNFSSSPTTAVVLGPAAASGARAKSAEAYSAQHPLTVVQSQHMDLKMAKQMANNTRRGFSGSREISADSGIASMDMALDSSVSSGGYAGRSASPKRSRSRPRNLQMIMNGRHKFEVRELDDPLSSDSSSIVEPLALPQLPTENQTVPLPLSGLVRSNTVLSRESFDSKNAPRLEEMAKFKLQTTAARHQNTRNMSEDSESIEEEKLYLDRSTSEKSAKHHQQFRDINTCSSKTSSPGSSIMSSWCNGGESLAVKDCSSLSISSNSEDSNKLQDKLNEDKKCQKELINDDVSVNNTGIPNSTISSSTETPPMGIETLNPTKLHINEQKLQETLIENDEIIRPDRPRSLYNMLNETKFAEMALEGSTYLLDDETSPTDSLVSSTESEGLGSKQKKHKINEELQEKDIDEISPELEVGSPISPGTPTHASHSLSLSDCGNLIDDEIADQPALLFNNEAQDGAESAASQKDNTDTPTLMETGSMRSLKTQSKARSALQQAIELSLRTPLSLRKAVMERAESLDTLSPCESICSDDLMMDFDMNSSVDSIDRSASIKSRSGSDLNKIDLDDTELFSELEREGSDVMKELNSILRGHTSRNAEKESVIAQLPARATRLLNRSRLQQQCPLNSIDSDSSKSTHSARRSGVPSRASTASTASNASLNRIHQQHLHRHHRDSHSSSDDLMLYDKSFRNAMIQDVLQFKKQLLRLRRILQEDEDFLMRTETLNPFETDNGQLFASCGLDSKLLDDIDLASLTSSAIDDPMQELADLRRQVVYLQGQVDDRERTIRLQRNLIEKLGVEKTAPLGAKIEASKECINMATQTERTRPFSLGPDGLSRSKPEYTSYTTHFPAMCRDSTTIIQHQQHIPSSNHKPAGQTRRHTIISTTLTNYNHQLSTNAPRRASIAWEKQTTPVATTTYKPVRITLIGEPLKTQSWNAGVNGINASTVTNGNHIEMEYKKGLLNSSKDILNGSDYNKNNKNSTKKNYINYNNNNNCNHTSKSNQNGYDESSNLTENGSKYAYQHLESTASTTSHKKHQQQQQKFYQSQEQHSPTNGNLNPTVTIV